jgi:hypothetical protein
LPSGDADAARHYREQERASYAGTPASRHMLRQQWPIIASAVPAVADPSVRLKVEEALAGMIERGWTDLVGALRRILDGERDEDMLCASLDAADSAIVGAVLRGIEDPTTLKDIAPAD